MPTISSPFATAVGLFLGRFVIVLVVLALVAWAVKLLLSYLRR
jgi:hypothetical protein